MAKLKVPRAGEDETQLRDYMLESAGYQANLDAMLSEIVNSQLQHYKAIEPIWLKEQGLQKTVNDDGSYTYTPVNQELYDQGREVEQLAQERTLKALKGELPVSPGLERDIQDQERVLNEQLDRQFGSGYRNTTPGAYQLMEFNKRSNEAREAERRGEIANAMNLTLGAQSVRSNRSSYDPTSTNLANKGNAIGAGSLTFGNSGTNYINAQSPYQFDRDMQFQKNLTKYAAKKDLQGALIGGGMQLGSQLLGTAAGAWAGGKSHPSFKEQITSITPEQRKQFLKWIDELPLYEWVYKGDINKEPHIGGMTTEMPEVMTTQNGMMIDMVSYLGILTGAMQELRDMIEALKGEQHETVSV